MPRCFFPLLSCLACSLFLAFSLLLCALHLVTGGLVLTSDMPHGFVFLCLCFALFPLTVWHVRTVLGSSITPASEEGETGLQAGRWERPRRDRVVPRCHDGVDGSECTAKVGAQGVVGHSPTVWGTYCTMQAHAAQYLPRTVPHHSTQPSFYLLFHHCTGQPSRALPGSVLVGGLWLVMLVCRGQHFSPSGLGRRATAMTKTKRGMQERDARYCSRYRGR